MFKISLIHPSRNRPKQAEATINKWLSSAYDKTQIEYILSVDKNDNDLSRYREIGKQNGTYVLTSRNKSAIEAINNAAKVSTSNLIVVVSDDFDCPEHWDEKLLKEVEGKEDFYLKTKDGIQDFIITMPVLDRKCYERFGYVYFEGYSHLFCDTEMAAVGHMTGRTIYSDLFFEHCHYSVKKSKKDAINLKNDKTWGQGKRLFYKRKSINFGLKPEEIVNPFPKQLE
jgi:hypothetical protein